MRKLRSFLGMLAVLTVPALLGTSARADSATFSAASGSLSAEADFLLTGNILKVTLINKSTAVADQSSILTAVLFDSNVLVGGTLQSVDLALGSVVVADSSGDKNTGLFGYSTNADPPAGQKYALSSSGLEINYTNPLLGLTGGETIVPPQSPDGPPGGLIGTGGISNHNFAYIENAITYTVSGVNLTNLTGIHTVTFQYGTSLSDTNLSGGGGETFAPLPAPAYGGMALLVGLGAFAKFGRRGLSVA